MFINIVTTHLIFISCVTFWSIMLLLLMLTGVLPADAGYHYDVPSVHFHSPSQQAANFQTILESSSSESQSLNSNSDYNANIGIAAPFTDNFHQGHAQTLSPVGFTNSGYAQTSVPDINLNNQYTSSSTVGVNVNSYQANTVSLSGTDNFNEGHALTTNDLNLNNDFTQTSEYSANAYSTFPHILLPPLESNLNGGFAQSADQNLNNPNVNTIIPNGAADFNNDFIQTISPTADTIISNNNVASVTPTVVKHVYFHVPPPDMEEQAFTPLPLPQKKTYKILFIKMPSQELSNTARLHQLVQSQNAGVEQKTLIYVLVNKPDPEQPVVVPQRTKSDHEVFFVKYNGDPVDIASQINDELEQTGSVESIVPILHPGLENGHK